MQPSVPDGWRCAVLASVALSRSAAPAALGHAGEVLHAAELARDGPSPVARFGDAAPRTSPSHTMPASLSRTAFACRPTWRVGLSRARCSTSWSAPRSRTTSARAEPCDQQRDQDAAILQRGARWAHLLGELRGGGARGKKVPPESAKRGGESGLRSRYLSHAKRAIYQLI